MAAAPSAHHFFFFKILYYFYKILRQIKSIYYKAGKCPGHPFLNFLDLLLLAPEEGLSHQTEKSGKFCSSLCRQDQFAVHKFCIQVVNVLIQVYNEVIGHH